MGTGARNIDTTAKPTAERSVPPKAQAIEEAASLRRQGLSEALDATWNFLASFRAGNVHDLIAPVIMLGANLQKAIMADNTLINAESRRQWCNTPVGTQLRIVATMVNSAVGFLETQIQIFPSEATQRMTAACAPVVKEMRQTLNATLLPTLAELASKWIVAEDATGTFGDVPLPNVEHLS